jgi:hypothetical protein
MRIRNEDKGFTKSKIFTSFALNYLIKYSKTPAEKEAAGCSANNYLKHPMHLPKPLKIQTYISALTN